jgi:NAD(P)-dependent dehydrogenase (short-subunit alcohol dehydrogenase family)
VPLRHTGDHRLGWGISDQQINMASNVALMGVAGLDCYTAAKGGIAAITRSMAVEFAPQKVRVNAIAPAATRTDLVRGRFGVKGINRLGSDGWWTSR